MAFYPAFNVPCFADIKEGVSFFESVNSAGGREIFYRGNKREFFHSPVILRQNIPYFKIGP